MASTSPMQTESELQWDPDSSPDYKVNCGPSSVEKVANFYKDLATYGIERTRRLGTSSAGTGTSTTAQKKMLDTRGVTSTVMALDGATIRQKIATGRRPIVIWMQMSYVPASVKGNTYTGLHALAGLSLGVVAGETGIWVNEPNQHRDRVTYKKTRFFPDKYWMPASRAAGRWCIVPDKEKVIATRVSLKKVFQGIASPFVNIRTGPAAATQDAGNLPLGVRFTSNLRESAGGSYKAPNGTTRRDWIGLVRNGRQVWIAQAYLKEV